MSGAKEPTFSDTRLDDSAIYIRYGVPILLTAFATIIKLWLTDYIGYKTPFMLYFGVVIITSKYFGKSPAIVITILSAISVNAFFLYPPNSLNLNKQAIIENMLFIFECGLMISLSTALTKAVKTINRNDARFKALVEKSSEGIATMNVNGEFLYCSPSVQNIVGYTDEELINLPSWQLLHKDERLKVKEDFFRFLSHSNQTFTFLHRMKHKKGHWIWIESKNTNLLNEPPINAIIANFSDVTERVLSEARREDFISIASHELKTPLTSLKAYTQLLQSRFKKNTDETSFAILNKIEFQVNKVIQMVTNLLDASTLQQKKLNLITGHFDMNVLLTELADALQQTSKNHRIILQLEPVKSVWADRDRLSQVITNMITNAIKYSPDANDVVVRSKTEGDYIIVSVQDKGIGIPQQDIQKVFDRFYRVDGSKTSFQGLGLGLFISKQIIEQHQGKIGADSEMGKGSVFWFSLPLQT